MYQRYSDTLRFREPPCYPSLLLVSESGLPGYDWCDHFLSQSHCCCALMIGPIASTDETVRWEGLRATPLKSDGIAAFGVVRRVTLYYHPFDKSWNIFTSGSPDGSDPIIKVPPLADTPAPQQSLANLFQSTDNST